MQWLWNALQESRLPRAELWSLSAARVLLCLRQPEFHSVTITESMITRCLTWAASETMPERSYGTGLLLRTPILAYCPHNPTFLMIECTIAVFAVLFGQRGFVDTLFASPVAELLFARLRSPSLLRLDSVATSEAYRALSTILERRIVTFSGNNFAISMNMGSLAFEELVHVLTATGDMGEFTQSLSFAVKVSNVACTSRELCFLLAAAW